jgi:murein L,D-transpeptidase YcbB/YkuD
LVAAPRLPPEADGIHFVDRALWPDPRWTEASIRAANPLYATLEDRLGESSATVRRDLGRLRLIGPAERFVLVDTVSARLWMVDRGKIAGTMKVIVGKPGMDTPMMAGLIRYAVLNPYWNVPPDLIMERVAGHVLVEGPGWLRRAGLQPAMPASVSARTLAR